MGELFLVCRVGMGIGGMNSARCPAALALSLWPLVTPSQKRRLGVRGSVMSKMRLTRMGRDSEGDVLSHAFRLREEGN